MSDQTNRLQIEDIYELSPLQEGMLFHTLLAPESGVYLEQLCVQARGIWSQDAMERALRQVIRRHPILRTAFCWEGLDKTVQVVHRDLEPPVETIEQEAFSARGADIETFLQADRRRGFTLDRPPLFRLTCVRESSTAYWLILTFHHVLLDGWSLQRLNAELTILYEAAWAGRDAQLPPARPYRDYIAWRQAQDPVAAHKYWSARLAGFWSPTLLASSGPGNANEYSEYKESLSADLTRALKQFAQQHRMTLNTVIQAAWAVVLGRHTASDDVMYGSIVSGRPATLPGVESILGLFINTIPVRVRLPGEARVFEWLSEFHGEQLAAREFEHTSLVDIHGWSAIPRNTPLFDTVVGLENYPITAPGARQPGVPADVRHFQRTNYPLAIAILPGDRLELVFLYDGSFDRSGIERLCDQYTRVLQGIIADPHRPLRELSLVGESEREQLLVTWNSTRRDYPRDRCFHELFESQVERTPDAVALTMGRQELTYSALNARSNQLAAHLRTLGVGPEILVGIAVERSIEMLVGVLGVLKAGGAYVPLDPTYPLDRLVFMLEDTSAPVLLTQARLLDRLPAHRAHVVCLDADWPAIASHPTDNVLSGAVPDNLAYVIYTSGSTGRPKGVMIEHRSLSNCQTEEARELDGRPDSRVLQFSTFSFDGWIFEVMLAFGAGARLCLATREQLRPGPDLVATLREQQITSVLFPPSALSVLPDADIPSLTCVNVAGESCPPAVIARWAPGRRFFNLYGPTETTCYCTFARFDGPIQRTHIGRPIGNGEIYILDPNRQPVAIGMTGELYVGGPGLARGYLNRPELTREKFVDHPFSTAAGARLYRTGDLGRYLPDGNIEFLGRVDHQIKLRGFRIELGEVESVLLEHGTVRDAVAVAREHAPGDRRLVAYLVPSNGPVPVDELRAYLRQKLPEYMVPSAFIQLASLPRSPSGKCDRAALPDSDPIETDVTDGVQPRTETEAAVAGIWRDVLHVERVGLDDSFFDLGGHSLLATQLISRLREEFQIELAFARFFETPTVAGVASAIDTLRWMQSGVSRTGGVAEDGLEEGAL